MPQPDPVVFLLDVDNTLLDNDQIVDDLKRHMTQAFGVGRQQRYWTIFEELRPSTRATRRSPVSGRAGSDRPD